MTETGNDQRAGIHPSSPAPDGEAGNLIGGPVSGVVIQAGVVSGGVHMTTAPQFAVPLPRQLPAGPPRLVDRAGELSMLDGLLARGTRGPLLVVITGAPGMGKSALALRWLHAHDSEFPDGQLHADLGGGSGSGEPVADVLARWLRALGVPREWIPGDEAELAALWRSVAAGRRLAVLVENAVTTAGVRMLLPGAGPSVVMVTSRRRLPGSGGDGARFIHVGPLPADAAVSLLGQIAGTDRVTAEHSAALTLVAYCGGVPLAVCAAAGHLATSAERIADAATLLDPLDGADTEAGMRAGLDAAYAALDADTARAYRMIGLHPGPDFTAGLTAAALAADQEQARLLLSRLTAACLAEPAGPGRYRFHDLIRAHARDLAVQQDPRPDHSVVLARIAGWYLCNCAEAERLLQPYRHRLRRDAAPVPAGGPEVTAATALDWMEAERHCLRAVVHAAQNDLPAAAWQLADGMWPLFLYRGHPLEQLDICTAGLEAARRCEDAEGQARMLDRAGIAARQLNRLDEAETRFVQAHELWRGLGNTRKATGTVRKLGWLAAERGDLGEAIEMYRRALRGYQEPATASPREAALTMIDLGRALTAARREDEAVIVLREAKRLLDSQPDPYNQARALAALGHAQAARPGEALPLLTRALEVMTRLGVVPARAEILETLALFAARAGDQDHARSRYQEALTLLPPGHRRVAAIRLALDALGDPGNGQ